jgi:hypothetical protein
MFRPTFEVSARFTNLLESTDRHPLPVVDGHAESEHLPEHCQLFIRKGQEEMQKEPLGGQGTCITTSVGHDPAELNSVCLESVRKGANILWQLLQL